MSRGGDYDCGENYPNEAAFWEKRAELALHSKRGRKALADLREALLALPEKRLMMGAISTPAIRAKYATQPDEVEFYATGTPTPNWEKRDALEACEQGDGVCAVGAYLWWKRVKAGDDPYDAMRALPVSADTLGGDLQDTALIGRDAGLTYTLAYLLADANDETYHDCTPEERWAKMLGWIDRLLAEPALAR